MTEIINNKTSLNDLNSRSPHKNIQKHGKEGDHLITLEEMIHIMKDMNLSKVYDETAVKHIFEVIDKEQTGSISKTKLFDYFKGNKKQSLKLQEIFLSKSEKAIMKLKKIRSKCEKAADTESIKDIDWIIECLVSNTLDEPDLFKKSDEHNNEEDALKQYSHAQEVMNKRYDISKITNISFKSTKNLNYNIGQFNKKSNAPSMINDNISEHSSQTIVIQEDGSIKSNNRRNTQQARMSLVSNLTEITNDKDLYLANLESVKANLGDRRSTINSVTPKIASELNNALNKIEDFEFNVFELDELVRTNTMVYVANEIFNSLYFYEDVIDEKCFRKFVQAISDGYSRDVAYHNDLHATDVMQTVYVMMEKGSVYYKCSLMEIDYVAILVAAMCHDFKHPGIGNSYLISSKHSIAMSFNDYSPLENYHLAESFKILMKPEYDILAHFTSPEFRIIRKRIIESVLATDMSQHSKSISALKNKINVHDIKNGENVSAIIDSTDSSVKFDNQQLILNNILHTADISNPAKISKVYKKWVELVFVEFFYQGDCEKKEGLSVSLLCDREITHISKAQIGFIKFVVRPTFDCLKVIIPEINAYVEFINKNLRNYEEEVRKEEVSKQKALANGTPTSNPANNNKS